MKLFIRSFHYALGILALAVGTLLPSCTQESFIESQEDEGVEMVIHVGDGTRTTNSGTSTLWEEEDELTVIHSAPGESDFWASRFTKNSGENSFTGKVKRLSAKNDWYVVYPYLEDNVAADQLSFTFPANQTQAGNASMAHLAGENFPLVAKSLNLDRGTQLNVKMKNVLHVLEFDFVNKTESANPVVVKEVQFTATSAIAGSFNVDLTGDDPVLTAESGATKVVKLGVTDGASISAGGTSKFYMAIAPFTAPAGSKLKVKVTALDTITEETIVFYKIITAGDNGIIFSSGTIQPIGVEFDEKNSQDPDAGSGTEVELPIGGEPENGTYLLVYENGENSYAFAAFDEYKSQNYRIPVVVENGVVLPQDGIDLARFAVELENTGEEHPNDAGHDAYNVRNSEGKYVFYATAGGTYEAADALHILDSNQMEVQGTLYHYYHTFAQTTDGVRIVCSIENGSGNKYLLSYTATDGFNYQQDNASGTNLHLFRIGGGAAKERQELVFSETSVTYDFTVNGEGPLTNKPTLTGSHTELSWESNNTDVATVDENGDVTIHGPGYATITVTAAADDTYYEASLSYTIESTSSDMQTWYKAEEIEAGKQYLVVSNGFALQNNNGSLAATSVDVNDDVITLMGSAPTSIIWTANANNQLTNNNTQYLGTTSSGQYNYSLSIGNASSATAWDYNADSNYLTCSISFNSSYSFTYYLSYSTNSKEFTISYSQGAAALYSTTKPLVKQNLSFDYSAIRWTVGEGGDHGFNNSYDLPQGVEGANTTLSYSSSNSNVADINGDQITVKGVGITAITVTAKEENGYKGATASYILRISPTAPSGYVDLGEFNLENNELKTFLDRAEDEYTDTNLSTSIVASITGNSATLDVPKPVTINWRTSSSGSATIRIYVYDYPNISSDPVWSQTASSGSSSADVYNLIPYQSYCCTVEDNTGILFKGFFETAGRRRMMKVSDTADLSRARNCRDLGGMMTTDGRIIKYNMIFRGTNLDGTVDNNGTERSIANYVAPNNTEQGLMANYMNIGWDIDLRQRGEGNGDVFLSKYNVTHVMCDYNASVSAITSDGSKVATTVRAFFSAAQNNKASYFHCRIGSDRTGFWGLLIEGLLGVSVKDCSIDYEITSFAGSMTSGTRTRNSGLFSDGIAHFKKQGSNLTLQQQVISYLTSSSVGITLDEITAFQNAVLE